MFSDIERLHGSFPITKMLLSFCGCRIELHIRELGVVCLFSIFCIIAWIFNQQLSRRERLFPPESYNVCQIIKDAP
jgi:hypothetical protein